MLFVFFGFWVVLGYSFVDLLFLTARGVCCALGRRQRERGGDLGMCVRYQVQLSKTLGV